MHIPSVGQRFNDIRADLQLTPDSLRIENVSARAVAGGLTASAEARLDGLTPLSARAQIRINEDDKLPLTVEGETIGVLTSETLPPLAVTAGNDAALKLYESLGFKAWGLEPAALVIDGVAYDEIPMTKTLTR